MSSLVKLYTQMKSEFTQAAQFFGENPSQVQLDDFFCNFATFIIDFEVSERKMYMYDTACVTLTPPPSLSLAENTVKHLEGTARRVRENEEAPTKTSTKQVHKSLIMSCSQKIKNPRREASERKTPLGTSWLGNLLQEVHQRS